MLSSSLAIDRLTILVAAVFFLSERMLVSDDGEAFFEKRIRPILVNHCYECHSGVNSDGGLRLDSRHGWQKGGDKGPAIVPGNPEKSLLIRAIRQTDEKLAMPPEDAGKKLSDQQIADLEKWVRIGAPDPRTAEANISGMPVKTAKNWWAFQPLPENDPNPGPEKIDALLERKLAEHSLTPLPPTDKRTLIRRATYDLTGLPPTPAEVNAFLADESPDAFTKLIDRLLETPQYGLHWGRH